MHAVKCIALKMLHLQHVSTHNYTKGVKLKEPSQCLLRSKLCKAEPPRYMHGIDSKACSHLHVAKWAGVYLLVVLTCSYSLSPQGLRQDIQSCRYAHCIHKAKASEVSSIELTLSHSSKHSDDHSQRHGDIGSIAYTYHTQRPHHSCEVHHHTCPKPLQYTMADNLGQQVTPVEGAKQQSL